VAQATVLRLDRLALAGLHGDTAVILAVVPLADPRD
jgi:hypothetical protein